MQNIIITAKNIKKELIILSIVFTITYIGNIYSIISYNTPWKELYSSLMYVFTVSFVLYFFIAFIRIIIYMIKKALCFIALRK